MGHPMIAFSAGFLGSVFISVFVNEPLLTAGDDPEITEAPRINFTFDDFNYFRFFKQEAWPDGLVWYDVDPHLSPRVIEAINYVINYVNTIPELCIKWIQRQPYKFDSRIKTYISFVPYNDTGSSPTCSALVGARPGRPVHLRLGENCVAFRLSFRDTPRYLENGILHEMGHTMNLLHEQQRPDRDCFVYVDPSLAIAPGTYGRFIGPYFPSGFPYDYDSIMHYQLHDTKVYHAHDNPRRSLGRFDVKFSPLDIHRLSTLYCGRKSYCAEHNSCEHFYDYGRTNPLCWRQGLTYKYDPPNFHFVNNERRVMEDALF